MSEFVAVAFEHGKPVRTQYVATSAQAEALVEDWKAEGLRANWARREDWNVSKRISGQTSKMPGRCGHLLLNT